MNLKLEQINRQYDDDAKNVYKEDAFARLLAGILYERGGTRDDLNDAFISNRIAANVYASDFAGNYGVGAPEVLGHNLISTAGFMGPEELEQAREVFPNLDPLPLAERQAKAQV
ncbi:MAG: hypothetical protein GWO16_15225, partial [Gammaproteobacteria bacterium]|nr:hypothetical protein [Gammaproteobacteria bacterium]NIT64995.1 hypothetical protein [Gammaproteobacteria bacterium]NIV22018.1 hypothetical protein [Gammaproteobacteria bacterium]NIY33574.1 hypothetical protein [Gammaproteobacteria bacterium]